MKKIMLLLLSAFLTIGSSAGEKITIDKVKGDYRIIETERTPHVFPYAKTLTDASISLYVIAKGAIKSYSICIYLFANVTIDKGSKLLLKLSNGEIIELTSKDASTTTGNALLKTITFTPYSVSEEQIKRIIANNVEKVRVETLTDNIDGKVYGKKFSKAISKDYELIEKALKQEKSIYDNF